MRIRKKFDGDSVSRLELLESSVSGKQWFRNPVDIIKVLSKVPK